MGKQSGPSRNLHGAFDVDQWAITRAYSEPVATNAFPSCRIHIAVIPLSKSG
ncbi:hypothetical protein [Bradyrhizobium canariense]|uniref:hypothetical protein n=1 Tax=Bradyrhizobium canariense TaxID=255045 RepID=UPI0013747C10|nr:hypothetical protein [Bradyrhizobium canariense]